MSRIDYKYAKGVKYVKTDTISNAMSVRLNQLVDLLVKNLEIHIMTKQNARHT